MKCQLSTGDYPWSLKVFLLVICAGMASAGTLSAQSNPVLVSRTNLQSMNRLNGFVQAFDSRYQGVEGSPYLLDYWNDGSVQLTNGQWVDSVLVKLDLYSTVVVVKRPKGDSVILSEVQACNLKNGLRGATWVFRKVLLPDLTPQPHFVKVLYDGKTRFFLRPVKLLRKADYKGPYTAGRPYDEFINENHYYLQKAEGTLVKVKLNKKSVMEVLQDRREDIEPFLRLYKENVDFQREEGIIKLLTFYDTR